MIRTPKYRKVLFVSDVHAPYEDKKAVKALITFAKWWEPNMVVYIGDLVDFYAVSSFVKDPTRMLELQGEIDAANDVLKAIHAAAPKADHHFLRGNHEHRLQKFLWTRAAELSGLQGLQVQNLLALNELGIKYHEEGRMKFRNMVLKHGDIVRKFAGYTAKGELDSTGISGVSGHTHRMGTYYQSTEGGDFTWAEIGCLCDLHPEYMEGKTPNWQQGFGIGYYKEGSRRFHIDTIPIIKGRAMYNGREFS